MGVGTEGGALEALGEGSKVEEKRKCVPHLQILNFEFSSSQGGRAIRAREHQQPSHSQICAFLN